MVGIACVLAWRVAAADPIWGAETHGLRGRLEVRGARDEGGVLVLPLGSQLDVDVFVENSTDHDIDLIEPKGKWIWQLLVVSPRYRQLSCPDFGALKTTRVPAHGTAHRELRCKTLAPEASALPPGPAKLQLQYTDFTSLGFIAPELSIRVGPDVSAQATATGAIDAKLALVDAAIELHEGHSGVPHKGPIYNTVYKLALAIDAGAAFEIVDYRGEFSDGTKTYPLKFTPRAGSKLWAGHVSRGKQKVDLAMDVWAVTGIRGIDPGGTYRYRVGVADAKGSTVWLDSGPITPTVFHTQPIPVP